MPFSMIGVTTWRDHSISGNAILTLSESYTQAISDAGACPLMIPLGLPEDNLDRLLDRLDGILFCGGGDIAPARYGGEHHPLVAHVDPDRDRAELHLVAAAIQRRLPFLGICRGLQVINVALGGTLYEDLTSQMPGALEHDYFESFPRQHLAHSIEVSPASRLHAILEADQLEVNSLHHQGVRRLAPGLIPTARAPDGLVEAVELPGYSFGLAVQWHPECLGEHPPMKALFREFVRCTERAGKNTAMQDNV